MENDVLIKIGVACRVFLAALDYFEIRNKKRKKHIIIGIFQEEGPGGSVWDENLDDKLDFLNRYEPFLAWLPAGEEKEHFMKRLLALDISHKIQEHGRKDLTIKFYELIKVIKSEQYRFPGLVALLPLENILTGMWD